MQTVKEYGIIAAIFTLVFGVVFLLVPGGLLIGSVATVLGGTSSILIYKRL